MSTLTKFLPWDASNQANCVAWAKGISDAIASFGWVKTSDVGQANWNTIPAVFDKDAPVTQTQNFLGAYDSGHTYQGSTSNNQLCDVVTYNGATWISVSNSNTGNTPGTDTTKWRMCNYEVWVSTGPKSGTNPIYLRLMYTASEDAGTPRYPKIFIGVSAKSDGNGNLTGNQFNTIPGSTPSPCYYNGSGYGIGLGSSGVECNFAGDADNLRWIIFRTSLNSGGMPTAMIIDRSKDSKGHDTDEYTTVCLSLTSNIGSPRQQTFFKTGAGGANILETQHFSTVHLQQTSYAGRGGVPAFPIFPLIGAVGNPLLGAVLQCASDTSEGALIKVSLYGTTHTYLVCKQTAMNSAGAQPSAVGILWE